MQTKGRRDTLQNPRTQQTRNTCEARVFEFGLHFWVLLSVPPAIVLQRTRSVSESVQNDGGTSSLTLFKGLAPHYGCVGTNN